MAQFGWNITNNFGAPSGGGGGGVLPMVLLGIVVMAVVSLVGAVVVPAVFAADAFLALLGPIVMWSALGLGSVALGGSAVWASRNALKTAQINRENGERYERMRMRAQGLPHQPRVALPPKTVYVTSQVGQTEIKELSES